MATKNKNFGQMVLVVEDDESIRENLKALLELEGYRVECAANGKEGLHMLGYIERPAIILLDLMMPEMNGWEFTEALGKIESLSDIPIVALTAFPKSAKTLRCNEIFRKPFDPDELLPVMRELIGERQAA